MNRGVFGECERGTRCAVSDWELHAPPGTVGVGCHIHLEIHVCEAVEALLVFKGPKTQMD